MSPGPSVSFEILFARLLAAIRERLVNGEYTERGLARAVGISQPHFHHILNGRRALTPAMADLVMSNLGWSALNVLTAKELADGLIERRAVGDAEHHIPVLQGRLGPDHPFPDWRETSDWLCIESPQCKSVRHGAVVELAPDAGLDLKGKPPWFALIAFDENLRLQVSPQYWYALLWRGAGYVRRVRMETNEIAVLGQDNLQLPEGPRRIRLKEISALHAVRARVLWVGSDPRRHDPFTQSGSRLHIATAS